MYVYLTHPKTLGLEILGLFLLLNCLDAPEITEENKKILIIFLPKNLVIL